MKTNAKFAVVGAAVLAVVLAGFNAKAAGLPAYQGEFTLSSAVSWGGTELPASHYTFTIDNDYPGSVVTVFRGTKTVARVQAVGLSTEKSGDANLVIRSGAVREMNLPGVGVSFHYSAPKSGHRMAPQQPALAQTVPVTMARAGR